MSESLGRLERDQLRKFAGYLIARLPEEILLVSQKKSLVDLSTAKIGKKCKYIYRLSLLNLGLFARFQYHTRRT